MTNLCILTKHEQGSFECPPILPADIKRTCFVIDNKLVRQISQLRDNTYKVGFLLQYAYFKACQRFFAISKFPTDMIHHASQLLSIHDVFDLSSYKDNTPLNHQKIILKLLDYKRFCKETESWLTKEVDGLIKQQVEPRQIVNQILTRLRYHHIEIPTYHRLADFITSAYIKFEHTLFDILQNCLQARDMTCLDTLLSQDALTPHSVYQSFKLIEQSSKPHAIYASLGQFKKIKAYFLQLKPVIDALNLSPNTSEYYATWVQKARLSQLKQMPD